MPISVGTLNIFVMEQNGIISLFLGFLSDIINGIATSSQQDKEFMQQQDLQKSAQMFQHNESELAYDRTKMSTQINDLTQFGVNPNLAVKSVLGLGNSAGVFTGSPTSSAPNSAVPAMSQLFGFNPSSYIDNFVKEVQAKNLEANTGLVSTKNQRELLELKLRPEEFAVWKNSQLAQQRQANAYADEALAKVGLDNAQEELVRKQAARYNELTDAQIEQYKAVVADTYEHIRTQKHQQNLMDKQAMNQENQAWLAFDQSQLVQSQEVSENYRGKMLHYEADYWQSHGVPVDAEIGKEWAALMNQGKIKEAETLMMSSFEYALNQRVGSAIGEYVAPKQSSIKLPFGIGFSGSGRSMNGLFNGALRAGAVNVGKSIYYNPNR